MSEVEKYCAMDVIFACNLSKIINQTHIVAILEAKLKEERDKLQQLTEDHDQEVANFYKETK